MATAQYPVPGNTRPSASVEDAAIRLIRAGWLGLTHVTDTGTGTIAAKMPSETVLTSYTVLAIEEREDGQLTGVTVQCNCMAGTKGQHCKHVTVLQLLLGFSRYWAPEPPLRPGTAPIPTGQAAIAAAAEAAPEPASAPEPAPAQAAAKPVQFGKTGVTCSSRTWAMMLEHLESRYPEWSRQARTSRARKVISKMVAANAGLSHCATCGEEQRTVVGPTGGTLIACPKCGIGYEIPAGQQAATAAA